MPGTGLDIGSIEIKQWDKCYNIDRHVQKAPNLRGNGKETGKEKGHRGFPMGIGTGGKTLMINGKWDR